MTTPKVYLIGDNSIDEVDTNELLKSWATVEKKEREYHDFRLRIEYEIQNRMQAEGATAIPHENLSCELKAPSPTYDLGKLNALRELLPADVIQTAFTPAHMEMVPDRWDARRFKTWAKYGSEVAKVIESSKIPGTPRLVIKAKEV